MNYNSPILQITQTIILIYVVVSIVHLLLQFIFAHLNHLAQKREKRADIQAYHNAIKSKTPPTFSVVYPIYNEQPAIVEQVLASALNSIKTIPNLEVIVVDDGSPNRDQVQKIYTKYEQKGLKVVYQENGGKREAQYNGFNEATGDYIITVDSDTIINPEGIIRLIGPMLRNPQLGAITGDVRVENRNKNLLTQLVSIRYWTAFNLERAAQSFTGSMLCCSGPFSIYRKDVIDKVKDDYINQYFMGKKCTYGDDRHLTNLVIREGYRTAYQEDAIAYTFVPETMGEYISQQTRWNKSFFREFLWIMKSFYKISLFSFADTVIQPILFLSFIFILSNQLLLFAQTGDLEIPAYYLVLLIVMAAIRSLYGLVRTGKFINLLFVFYGFIHVLILMPIRFKALLTLADNGWGTRLAKKSKKSNVYLNFALWSVLFSLTVVVLSALLQLAQTGAVDLVPESIGNTTDPAFFAQQISYYFSFVLIPFVFFSFLFIGEWFVTQGERFGRRIKLQTTAVASVILLITILSFLPAIRRDPQVAGIFERRDSVTTENK